LGLRLTLIAVLTLLAGCATTPPPGSAEDLARKEIAKAMNQVKRAAYHCGTVQQRHESQLSGTMTVTMLITPSGNANDVQITPPRTSSRRPISRIRSR